MLVPYSSGRQKSRRRRRPRRSTAQDRPERRLASAVAQASAHDTGGGSRTRRSGAPDGKHGTTLAPPPRPPPIPAPHPWSGRGAPAPAALLTSRRARGGDSKG